MEKNKKILVGIIGKNFGYKVIYKALLKNNLFKVGSFCFKEKKNIPDLPKNIKIYKNWKKIVEDKKLKALIVSVPPFLQKKILLSAIKNNKHIFCEKPCTKSSKDLSEIISLLNKKKTFLSHMVNYTIAYLPAFQLLKKKISNPKITIKEADLEWVIFNRSSDKSWKNSHIKGGGVLFNYYCHALYYLELIFGNIHSTKVDIQNKIDNDDNYILGDVIFKSKIKIKIKILVGNLKKHKKSIHQLRVKIGNNDFLVLSSRTKKLSDQFQLYRFKNMESLHSKKILYKKNLSKKDFRICPTLANLRRFAESINLIKIDRSSFFIANRIHKIINKSLISSKMNKRVIIN